MKIAIATENTQIESAISHNAGRSPYYIIVDTEGSTWEVLSNDFATNNARGAGPGVSKILADKSVNVLIAQQCGEKMRTSLEIYGIKFHPKEGIAKDVLSEYSNN